MLKYQKKTYTTTIYEVAKWFLHKENMPSGKLQALCYYAYCWYLAEFNNGMQNELFLLFPQKFQAWIHGARCPELREFCDSFEFKIPSVLPNETTEKFLREVWNAYGHLNDWELESLALSEPPFKNARKGLEPYEPCTEEIKDEDIFKYFRGLMQ